MQDLDFSTINFLWWSGIAIQQSRNLWQ